MTLNNRVFLPFAFAIALLSPPVIHAKPSPAPTETITEAPLREERTTLRTRLARYVPPPVRYLARDIIRDIQKDDAAARESAFAMLRVDALQRFASGPGRVRVEATIGPLVALHASHDALDQVAHDELVAFETAETKLVAVAPKEWHAWQAARLRIQIARLLDQSQCPGRTLCSHRSHHVALAVAQGVLSGGFLNRPAQRFDTVGHLEEAVWRK